MKKSSFKGRLQPVVVRRYVPLMSDYFMTSYSKTENYQKLFFCDYYTRCGYVVNGYYYGPEAAEFGEVLFEIEKKKKGFIDKVFENIYKMGEEVMLLSEKIRDTDYSGYSMPQLLEIFKDFSERYGLFSLCLMGFNLQMAVENRLRKAVKGREHSDEDVNILSFPLKENFTALEQKNLLRIKSELDKSRIKRFENLPSLLKKMFDEHVKEHGWINTRGGQDEPWTERNVFDRCIRLKGDPLKKLDEIEKHKIEINKKSEKLLKELGDDELGHLVKIAKELVYYRTYRTDYLNKMFANVESLLEAIAEKRGLTHKEVLHLRIEEILKNEPVSKEEINRRIKGYALITIEPHKLIFSSDPKEIEKLKQEYCEEFVAEAEELKGNTAYKGKIKGRAKIVISKEDMPKVEEGDIIVAPMTTPEMIPAMERAAAFVTDEGGITCHAAIISREMKKPCVVGTKVATKVFNDGDMVEVDADKGIVRKIDG